MKNKNPTMRELYELVRTFDDKIELPDSIYFNNDAADNCMKIKLRKMGVKFTTGNFHAHYGIFGAHGDAIGDGDPVELDRRPACRSDARLDVLGQGPEVDVAGRDLRPGVEDRDQGALEVFIGEARAAEHGSGGGPLGIVSKGVARHGSLGVRGESGARGVAEFPGRADPKRVRPRIRGVEGDARPRRPWEGLEG